MTQSGILHSRDGAVGQPVCAKSCRVLLGMLLLKLWCGLCIHLFTVSKSMSAYFIGIPRRLKTSTSAAGIERPQQNCTQRLNRPNSFLKAASIPGRYHASHASYFCSTFPVRNHAYYFCRHDSLVWRTDFCDLLLAKLGAKYLPAPRWSILYS